MDREMKVLNVSSGLQLFATGLLGPIYAIFVVEIGGGALAAGTTYSIYSVAAGIMLFFFSRWEDRVEYKDRLLVAGYALTTLSFLGYMLVETILHLFLVQALIGVATAIRTPAFDELYSKHLDEGQYASEWGVWESMYWTVTGISAFVGGLLVSRFSFDLLFGSMAGLTFAATAVSVVILQDRSEKRSMWERVLRLLPL